MPANTVKVDRATRWGNPFADGATFRAQLERPRYFDARTVRGGTVRSTIDDVRRELRGKNLACWCALPMAGEPDLCHAAVLLEVANGEPGAPPLACGKVRRSADLSALSGVPNSMATKKRARAAAPKASTAPAVMRDAKGYRLYDDRDDAALADRWRRSGQQRVIAVLDVFWVGGMGNVHVGTRALVDEGTANWLVDHRYARLVDPEERGKITHNLTEPGWSIQDINAGPGDAYFDTKPVMGGKKEIWRVPTPASPSPFAWKRDIEPILHSSGTFTRKTFTMSSDDEGPTDPEVLRDLAESMAPDTLPSLDRCNRLMTFVKNEDIEAATYILAAANEAASRQGPRRQLLARDAEVINDAVKLFLFHFEMWKREEVEAKLAPIQKGRKDGGKTTAEINRKNAEPRHTKMRGHAANVYKSGSRSWSEVITAILESPSYNPDGLGRRQVTRILGHDPKNR